MVQNAAPRTAPQVPGKRRGPLHYYNGVLVIAFFYLALLIVPWALTCLLARSARWTKTEHGTYSDTYAARAATFRKIFDVVRFFDGLEAVVSLPVLAYLLARAAVVFSQRRRPKQSLNARQLFALADSRFCQSALVRGESTSLAIYGAILLGLACLTIPIKSLLVAPTVMYMPRGHEIQVGHDPNPSGLKNVDRDLLIEKTKHNMIIANWDDVHTNLWRETPDVSDDIYSSFNPLRWNMLSNYYSSLRSSYVRSYDSGSSYGSYFVTAMENGTTTGLLRDYATRVNTTASCVQNVTFPSICGGVRPFTATYSDPGTIDINICVPGSYDKYPWTGTRDTQTITEYLYVKVDASPDIPDYQSYESFAVRCEAQTTYGYFELGSYHNDGQYGALLAESPYLAYDNDYDSGRESDTPGDGPLMTAALALFGNNTFFSAASSATNETVIETVSSICDVADIPYRYMMSSASACSAYVNSRPDSYTDDEWVASRYEALSYLLWRFLRPLSEDTARNVIEVSTFFATEAWLTTASTDNRYGAVREIESDIGVQVMKPDVSLGVLIAVTLLIALQAFMVIILLCYIYSNRVWTPTLDALAVARIAHQLKDNGVIARGGLRPPRKLEIKALERMDALVGYTEPGTELDMIRSTHPHPHHDIDSEMPPPPHDDDDRPPPYVGEETDPVPNQSQRDQQPPEPNGTISPRSPSTVSPPAPAFESEIATSSLPTPPFVLRVGGQGLVTRRLARKDENWVAV